MRAFVQPSAKFVGMGWGRTPRYSTRVEPKLTRELDENSFDAHAWCRWRAIPILIGPNHR